MVANSKTNKRGSESKPVLGKQDVIDMLLAWCEMASEVGLEIEQLYAPEKRRFSVRVAGVALVEEGLTVVHKEGV